MTLDPALIYFTLRWSSSLFSKWRLLLSSWSSASRERSSEGVDARCESEADGSGSLGRENSEIQVAIRSLRLRFTEISKALKLDWDWDWDSNWVLGTGTVHTWPADLIWPLSPASRRLQAPLHSSANDMDVANSHGHGPLDSSLDWRFLRPGKEWSRDAPRCLGCCLGCCLMNNAFKENARSRGIWQAHRAPYMVSPIRSVVIILILCAIRWERSRCSLLPIEEHIPSSRDRNVFAFY